MVDELVDGGHKTGRALYLRAFPCQGVILSSSLNLVDELHGVARALTQAGVTYAVCGGVAVTIHGATRTTKDIDLLIDRVDLGRALDAVRPLGFAFAALPMTFDTGTPRERHVQRVSKIEGQHLLVLDFLLAEAGLAGLLEGRTEVHLPEGPLAVVSRDTLIKMKRLAGRPQDAADLEKLEHPDEV